MRSITLGTTGITVPQWGFGALPIQRISLNAAVRLVRRAYEGGFRFFDTAHDYTDSEEKLGAAFEGMRDKIFLASKTHARTPEGFFRDLDCSLERLRTDHIDIYQFHCTDVCCRPGDGSGMYEAMLKAKAEGKILHIGATAHKIGVAEEIAESGLYETLQYPFNYLAAERDLKLIETCRKNKVGFIAMKGLSGGLLNNARACMAYLSGFDAVPIWGIQREEELDEFLSAFSDMPLMDEELSKVIEKDRRELSGDFCRSCGYCMPCTAGIEIRNCARMSQLIRRAPSAPFLTEAWQKKMLRINDCVGCGSCLTKCPYSLNIPSLLKKNLADYLEILNGKSI